MYKINFSCGGAGCEIPIHEQILPRGITKIETSYQMKPSKPSKPGKPGKPSGKPKGY